VNLDNDGLWGVVDYLDSTLAAPVAAVAINYRFLTRGRLYRDIPLRERKFERLRPKIEGHFGILKNFFEEKNSNQIFFPTFNTTAGKNAQFCACLLSEKAVPKSLPFFKNLISPLSRLRRHVMTSLLPKGSP
jgi:hypothetical protein